MRISAVLKREKVYLQFSHQKVRNLLGTKFEIDSKFWNPNQSCFRKTHPDGPEYNKQLKQMIDTAYELHEKYQLGPKELKEFIIEHGFVKQKKDTTNFIEFCKKQMVGRGPSDVKALNTLCKQIASFDSEITLTGWTEQKLDQFAHFLSQQPNITSQTTIVKKIKRVSTILNLAIRYGKIRYEDNPFKIGYTIKQGKPKDIKLELSEVKRLWDNRDQFENEVQNTAIRIWLMSFLMDGARYRDVLLLKKTNIYDGLIRYTAHKTGKIKEVTMTEQLKQLIDEWGKTKTYVIPYIDKKKEVTERTIQSINAILNRALKDIATILDINPDIHIHAARHTFAYQGVLNGLDVVELQQALGHSKLEQTRDYIGRFNHDLIKKKRSTLHGLL